MEVVNVQLWRRACVLLTALVFSAGGCQSAAPKTQVGSGSAERLSISATDFVDTDEDRIRDTAQVIVYVFSGRSAIPIRARGALAFRLSSMDGRVLAEWTFSEAEATSFQGMLPPGPAYVVPLQLDRAAAARVNEMQGELTCRFRDSSTGQVIAARPSAGLLLGQQRRPAADPGSR